MSALASEVRPRASHDSVPDGALEALVERLQGEHAARVVRSVLMPAHEGRFASLPDGVDQRLACALESKGINRLYTHQAEAWASITAGRHSVIVTPTASGKTLCYNLPILQSVISE